MGLKAEREAVRERARTLLGTARDRDLTPEELAEVDQLSQRSTKLDAEIEKSERSQAVLRGIEGLGPPEDTSGGLTPGRKTWRAGVPHPWRSKVIEAGSRGGKQLAPGGVSVPSLLPEPAEMGQPPANLLALLPRTQLTDGNQVAFLQQTQATSAADVVEPGALKPTGEYEFELVTGQVVVVAELSGPHDRFLFQDFSRLDQVLGSQMAAGIQRRVEAYCVAGLEAAATAAPSGEFVESVRLAIAALEEAGITPNGIVMNPTDSARVDLLQDLGGAYLGSGPFQTGPTSLWGLARVSSVGVEQGGAYLGDFRQTTLWERGSVEISWTDVVGEDFTKNLVRFRAEQRVFFGVLQPPAVVKLDASQIGPEEPEGRSAPGQSPASQPQAQSSGSSARSKPS